MSPEDKQAERLCARPLCTRGEGYARSTEYRINNYCSCECEDMHELEQEIDALRAQVAQQVEDVGRITRERDEAHGILATTADRLNTALREAGCGEILGSPYHSFAIRDGVVDLYDRGAQHRAERDALAEEVEELTCKGQSLCGQNGNLLIEQSALRARLAARDAVVEAARPFLTFSYTAHDKTKLEQSLAALDKLEEADGPAEIEEEG